MADPTPPAPPAPIPDKIAVEDDSGKVHIIDGAGLSDAVAAGLKPVGRNEALAGLKSEYMQTPVGELATAAAGFLRGGTGGLSDLALDRTGAVQGSDLHALSELNPVSSTLGHAAGLGAALFVPGEGEAAAAGAGAGGLEALGADAAAQAGFGGSGSLLSSLAGGAPGAITGLGKLAEDVAGEGALGTLAKGAVEGAGFQAADNLTEDVFHDKQLTAESLLAHTGTAALLGAGGGLAFEKALGIAKTAVPRSLESAGSKLDDLKTWDEARSPEAKAGVFSEKLNDLAQTRQDLVEDVVGVKRKIIEQALDGKNWNFNADQFADNLDSMVKPIGEEGAHKSQALLAIAKYRETAANAKTALQQFDAADELRSKLGALAGFDKDLSVNGAQRMAYAPIQNAFGTVRDFLQNEDIWGEAGAAQRDFNAKLSPFLNDSKKGDFIKGFFSRATDSSELGDAVNGRVGDEFKALQYLKRESMTTPEGRLRAAASREALDGAIRQTQELQQFAEDQASRLGTGSARVRDVKAAVNELQKARAEGIKAAGPSTMEWMGRVLVPLGLRGPTDWIGRLTKQGEVISRAAGLASEVTKTIASGVRTMLEGSATSSGGDLVAAETPNIEHWLNFDNLAAHNADPSMMMNSMAAASPNLQAHAPTVAVGAQQVAATAAQYLQAHAPKNPVPPSGLPGDPKYTPSPSELETYKQKAAVIERPLSVLDLGRKGELLPSHVDAVATVFPRLYQQIVDEQQSALAERREPIPYKQQLMLATLLRSPVGFTQQVLSPMFQKTPAAPPPRPDAAPQPNRTSKSVKHKLGFASASQTSLASADRLGGK